MSSLFVQVFRAALPKSEGMTLFPFVTCAFLAFMGCSPTPHPPPVERESAYDVSSGGPVAIPVSITASVQAIESANVFLVTGEFSEDWIQHKDSPKVEGFPAFEKRRMAAATARRIGAILSRPENFLGQNDAWTCLPHPYYLITFTGSEGSGYILVDGCGDIEVCVRKGKAEQKWMHGLRRCSEEQEMWALLRRALPSSKACCD